jgi:thiol:disulfide interchange protein
VLAGVRLQMDPGWHTYWKNPGDSGGPTKIEWELPPGVTAGDIQWPLPEKLTVEEITTYVFHDEVTLLVPLMLAADLKTGPLEIKAKVSWLECEKLCVPGDASLSAPLQIAAETKASANAALLEAGGSKLRNSANVLASRVAWEKPAAGDLRPLILEWSTPGPVSEPDFFPDLYDAFEVQAATEVVSLGADKVRLRKMVKKFEGNWPTAVSGVLIQAAGGARQGFSASLPIAGSLEGSSGSAAQPLAASKTAGSNSLWQMLLYAFIGGLILNIMPCVLPVIALKILGFVGQSREAPVRVRSLGLVYAAGVLVSFLALASVVIGLKAAGQAAGWGMQFSSPQFTIAFSVLVTLVALNLFGVFEVTLGGGVMDAAGNLAARHGASGAFFNGVLATVLATPCTAPFLSLALGFAFSQRAPIIVLIFLTVGAGLASPYVVLSWFPAWLRWLPKPGAWMERFKVAMGFPMLATALWLASLVTDRYGERAWWLGIFLVFIGIAAWVFGEFIQRGRKGKGLAAVILLGVLALAYFWVLDAQLQWQRPLDASKAGEAQLKNAPKGYSWKRWNPEAVDQARAAGRTVIIDFTAKWCITCNSIVKPALGRPAVIEQFARLNVAAFVADYSDYGSDIAAEMKRFDRAAVPLVLVFPSRTDALPIILPDPNPLLGSGHYASLVIEALINATK